MGISLFLVLALVCAVTTFIFGFIRKDKRLKIIGGISLILVIAIIIFLVFVLLPRM